jgi:hypothetical protein
MCSTLALCSARRTSVRQQRISHMVPAAVCTSSVCVLAVCVNQLTDKIETIKIQRGAPDCRVDERERDLQARAEYERDRAECKMIWCVNKLTLANSCVLN